MANEMNGHEVVNKEQWLARRRELLAQEKEFTKAKDALAAERRQLPWVEVDEAYAFETENGSSTLAALFGTSSQLLVYHFMLGPNWSAGCPSCSFWADGFDHLSPHLQKRDAAFVVVSRAPLAEIQAVKTKMGWKFPWVSSSPSAFNNDFGVSFPDEEERTDATYNFTAGRSVGEEMPGASAFIKVGDKVFHTYSTYSRGLDILNGAYQWLDIAPKGRDEDNLDWPMQWVKRRVE